MKLDWYKASIFFLIVISFLIRLKNINSPLLDAHYFRQTQTATVARNFYRQGIDVFHPRIDIAGVGKEQVLVLEFPFYQAFVSILSNVYGFTDRLGKLVSIFWGLLGGIILAYFVKIYTKNETLSLTTYILFMFAPLNIFFHQAFMIESTVVTLHLISLYAWLRFTKRASILWYSLSLIFTSLAFVHKSVYAPFLILPIIGIIVLTSHRNKSYLLRSALGVFLALFLLFSWQKYADYTNSKNGQGYFTTTNVGHLIWNVGLLEDRFSPKIWSERIISITNSVTKVHIAFFLVGLVYLVTRMKKVYIVWLLWLFSMLTYYLIFFRIQSHIYYFMIVLPILSIISSYGVLFIGRFLARFLKAEKSVYSLICYTTVAILLIFYCTKSYINVQPFFTLDTYMQMKLEIINSGLKKEGFVVFVLPEYDWNSVYTYYTDRRGIALGADDVNQGLLDNFTRQGYIYMVFDDAMGIYSINPDIRSIISQYQLNLKEGPIEIFELL